MVAYCAVVALLVAGSSTRSEELDLTQRGGDAELPLPVVSSSALGRNVRTTLNVDAADTTNADEIWAGTSDNLTGSGITVGVWDGGAVRSTHQEFGGRVTVVDGVGTSEHSTHVAGTIGAAGVDSNAHGMATQVSIRSRDFNNDVAEMATDALLIDLSNHSYSFIRGWRMALVETSVGDRQQWYGDRAVSGTEDVSFGQYSSTSRGIDEVLHDNPHLLTVWSAGNDRNDYYLDLDPDQYLTRFSTPPTPGTFVSDEGGGWYVVDIADYPAPPSDGDGGTGYDSLSNSGQTAKNTLVVGAVGDVNDDPYGAGDISITSFSSYGATDDGRLGVDVVANGDGLYSTSDSSDTGYTTISGTSMSAPNATGTAALLVEHYQNQHGALPSSATSRALITHTAFDAGNTGPDYSHGYGLMDGEAAAGFLDSAPRLTGQVGSGGMEDWLYETTYTGSEWSLPLFSNGTDPLKLTLAWTDPESTALSSGLDDRNSMLVNDLDLWLTGPSGGTFYPWTLDVDNPSNPAVQTGLNHIDNMEQVYVDSPVTGWYALHVGDTGGVSSQDFSLLGEGAYTTPEPGSALLLGLVALGLLAVRQRRWR
jgi:MYXO-CTERM domain-containing protein